ncbi:isoprenylcysteine carboxyl methyltransferase [Pandoraea terrae]|uniref:Isoprenylcysteine carboxyl methyltransferase n=2 Tax=Pandoraea terrae TaxID=1537710 RepID=A0A5E4VH68_9BURK|nr:isoprenylcysteine carboxyl methyltransferase [Pandoraea terrae]
MLSPEQQRELTMPGHDNPSLPISTGLEAPRDSSPGRPRTHDELFEVVVRVSATLLLSLFAYSAVVHWRAEPGRITLLLLVVDAFLIMGLSLFARVPKKRDWGPVSFLCTMGATYYFLAVQLAPGTKLIPETLGAILQVSGILWQFFAKASLRGSFGLLPANRGIVSRGAYRFMRHPMYLGYLITDIGFLFTNFGWQNLLVYGIQFGLQVGRIIREERLLSADQSYRAYMGKVRYRVIPGIF